MRKNNTTRRRRPRPRNMSWGRPQFPLRPKCDCRRQVPWQCSASEKKCGSQSAERRERLNGTPDAHHHEVQARFAGIEEPVGNAGQLQFRRIVIATR